jgi:hypothetical protein
VDAIVGEPFLAQMQALPLLQAWAYWCRCSALRERMPSAYRPRTLPAAAIVWAQAVRFQELHRNHAPVGVVNGFDHAALDVAQARAADSTFSYPLWQYDFVPVSEPAAVFEMAFAEPAPLPGRAWADPASGRMFAAEPLGASGVDNASGAASAGGIWPSTPGGTRAYRCGGTCTLTALPGCSAEAGGAGGQPEQANAVIVWVDFALDVHRRHIVTTHPTAAPHARQAVRFFPAPVAVGAQLGSGPHCYVSVFVDEAAGVVDMEIGQQ